MSLEQLFSLASGLAMIGWIFLAVFPRRRITPLISAILIPMALSALYLFLIANHFQGAEGGFGSLADVAALFTKQELLLAGWIHYLAFDLFTGAWEVRDAQRNQIPHLVVLPCLVMTFMLGPIGLLFYFAIRTAKTKSFALGEAPVAPEQGVGG